MRSQDLIKLRKESKDAKFHKWSALQGQILRIRIHVYPDILHCHLLVPEVCTIYKRRCEDASRHINCDCSIASFQTACSCWLQWKNVQRQVRSNACIYDKDGAACGWWTFSERIRHIKLGGCLAEDLFTKNGETIQKQRENANGADSSAMDKVRREWVTVCKGVNETVGSLSEDAILYLKIRSLIPRPIPVLAGGIRSCCHTVVWRSVAVLLSALGTFTFAMVFCIYTGTHLNSRVALMQGYI
jgi:hypothetical protein